MADQLTAEELARYKTLPEVLCVCGGQYDGKRLLATIDAQQAEIAALRRQAETLARLIGEAHSEIVALKEALNQQGHVAEFREDGYALEHPIECRASGLLNCAVHEACEYEQAPPALGRFAVSIDDDGFLVLGAALKATEDAQ